MKKLLILFVLIFFASCEKDGSRGIECYTCRWESKTFSTGAYYSYIIDTCLFDVGRYESVGTWENTTEKSRVMCWPQGDPPLPNPGF
jgi:hypothetical protein